MKETIKEKIRKQILMGGGETLVDAIYLIFEAQREDISKKAQKELIAGLEIINSLKKERQALLRQLLDDREDLLKKKEKEGWGCAYCNILNYEVARYCMNCGTKKKI